jgi:hypothetical protein
MPQISRTPKLLPGQLGRRPWYVIFIVFLAKIQAIRTDAWTNIDGNGSASRLSSATAPHLRQHPRLKTPRRVNRHARVFLMETVEDCDRLSLS